MKNFKKVGCMLVGCAMVVSVFAGCSADKAAQQNTKKDATVSGQETVAEQLANQDNGAVKKTSQEIAMERLTNRKSGELVKSSQEIAQERMAARKAAEESKPSEPAEKETEQVTESTAVESEPTEPVVSMQNNNTSGSTPSKPAEQKPAESTQTQPKATEPAPTQPTPTEPKPTEPVPTEPAPTEPPKVEIDTAALEAYGRQYAASLGFTASTELNLGNSSYFPAGMECLNSTDEGYGHVSGYIDATYAELIAAAGSIEGARCNVIVEYDPVNSELAGGNWYCIWVLYG